MFIFSTLPGGLVRIPDIHVVISQYFRKNRRAHGKRTRRICFIGFWGYCSGVREFCCFPDTFWGTRLRDLERSVAFHLVSAFDLELARSLEKYSRLIFANGTWRMEKFRFIFSMCSVGYVCIQCILRSWGVNSETRY